MKKHKKIIICLIAILVMGMNFSFGIFIGNEYEKNWFNLFQNDSEDLVYGKIYKDMHSLNENKYGLQFVDYGRETTKDYMSSVGLQGFISSFLCNKLHIPVNGVNVLCAFITAIVIVSICNLLNEKYGKLFSFTFYIVFLLSPWIVNFARNLYWVEFTWFLPLLFCLLLTRSNNKKLYLPLIYGAILVKCLCGYEYISTIMLTTITFLVVDYVLKKDERKAIMKTILQVGIICLLAFFTAICIHGIMRGNGNIISGINTIYKEDVLRRTIGNNPDLFEHELIKESIIAPFSVVLNKYLHFGTDIVYGVNGKLFTIIAISSLVIILYGYFTNRVNSIRDLIIYIMFFLAPVSWFILGKAHSYIHTGMNYVLWYFGFIQICMYTIVKYLIQVLNYYKERENEV